jgi:hypothetical protein
MQPERTGEVLLDPVAGLQPLAKSVGCVGWFGIP